MKKQMIAYKKTNLLFTKIDPMKIKSVARICKEHPRINRVVNENGMYMFLQEHERVSKQYTIYRVSIGMADVEPDQFDVGYYEVNSKRAVQEALEMLYKENWVNYVCEQLLNHYVPVYLKMPAPTEKHLEYISTPEEEVDMVYISERMSHSIMRKLWQHITQGNGDNKVLADEIGLTEKERELLVKDCLKINGSI